MLEQYIVLSNISFCNWVQDDEVLLCYTSELY